MKYYSKFLTAILLGVVFFVGTPFISFGATSPFTEYSTTTLDIATTEDTIIFAGGDFTYNAGGSVCALLRRDGVAVQQRCAQDPGSGSGQRESFQFVYVIANGDTANYALDNVSFQNFYMSYAVMPTASDGGGSSSATTTIEFADDFVMVDFPAFTLFGGFVLFLLSFFGLIYYFKKQTILK